MGPVAAPSPGLLAYLARVARVLRTDGAAEIALARRAIARRMVLGLLDETDELARLVAADRADTVALFAGEIHLARCAACALDDSVRARVTSAVRAMFRARAVMVTDDDAGDAELAGWLAALRPATRSLLVG